MLGLDSIFLPAFRLVYRRRRPQPVGRRAPRLTWLPKFETSVHIPDEVLDAPDPHEALEARLAALGFSIDHWTRDELVLGRGKRWGDFSIKLIRLHAAFALPLRAETTMMVKVADVCLFDTGDTWKLTRDLKAAIEEGASGQGRPPES